MRDTEKGIGAGWCLSDSLKVAASGRKRCHLMNNDKSILRLNLKPIL